MEDGHLYRQEQSGVTAGGRGVLTEQVVIGWQGDPVECGRRWHEEALRGGLGRAQARLVAGAGASWIWNVPQACWAGATEGPDFSHARQQSLGTGLAVQCEDEDEARTAK